MSTVIGIHDGHNASVALVRDGRIELALQEERLTRIKNQGDAPALSLAYALKLANGSAGEARIALNGRYMNYHQWERETILEEYAQSSSFASRLKQPLKNTFVDRIYQERKSAERQKAIASLGVDESRIQPIWRRSSATASSSGRSGAWGCGRRDSVYRRCSVSSSQSRNRRRAARSLRPRSSSRRRTKIGRAHV